VTQWKTKKKCGHKKNLIRTGGGGCRLLELSELEKSLIYIIFGWAVTIGSYEPSELHPQT
jgi:hypothetical protein